MVLNGYMVLIRATRQFSLTLVFHLLFMAGCVSDSGLSRSDSNGVDSIDKPNAQSQGLLVRLRGRILGDMICPGDRRPCLQYDGSVSPNSERIALVVGRIVDGRLIIDEQLDLPSDTFDRDYATNRCANQDIVEPPHGEWFDTNEGSPPVPGFVDSWSSADGTYHIAVAGDGSEAEAALEQQGVTNHVCLVTGFPSTYDELDQLWIQIMQVIGGWADRNTDDLLTASIDTLTSTIKVFPGVRIDPERRAAIENVAATIAEANAITIDIQTSIEIINGTLDDFDRAMSDAGKSPHPEKYVKAACGSVRFTTIPPDVNEFPPLDNDAQAALGELVEGPTRSEAEGIDAGFTWSIAFRDNDQMVLFGQGSQPGEYMEIKYERKADAWKPAFWGGCHIKIEAPGFDVTRVFLDPRYPIDSDATELPLLINKQTCAHRQISDNQNDVPLVNESDNSVEIVVFVEPVTHFPNACQRDSIYPISVSLQKPVGDRELLDAHIQPPTPMFESPYWRKRNAAPKATIK